MFIVSVAWGELAGWTALVTGLLAHLRIDRVRQWAAQQFLGRDLERQHDLLSIAERLEPDGPSSDGLPPRVSEKFRRKAQ